MKKIGLITVFLFFAIAAAAQDKSDEIAIRKVIATFFEGLHKGDSSLLKKTLHSSLKIQSTSFNKEGKSVLKTETTAQLLQAISSKKSTVTYFEKLLSIDIKIDGNLASVWTPYEFYYNGTFSHCGANSFQFFKEEQHWKIIYLVDIRRRTNCQPSEANK